MRRYWAKCDGIVVRGRLFTQPELVLIRKLIRDHPTWGRTKLSQRVCQKLGWLQPNGRVKERACRVALLKLESMGFLELPTRILDRGGRRPRVCGNEILRNEKPISEMPSVIDVCPVQTKTESRLWNALIAQYHYLGLATPVGRLIRYLFIGDGQIVGAIAFADCAWNIRKRTELLKAIGITECAAPQAVITNTRFLVLPHVTVPNLASRILGASTRHIRKDWLGRYGYEPAVAETFVDPSRYSGTCYLAANWIPVGSTKGYSKHGCRHVKSEGPKILFLRGLRPSIHRRLEVARQRRFACEYGSQGTRKATIRHAA